MNEPTTVLGRGVLDWLHEQGRKRAESVPEFDLEATLRVLRVVREGDAYARIASQARIAAQEARSGTGAGHGEGEAKDADAEADAAHSDAGDFCVKHRAEWLSYAFAHARNLQDAEDAVSYVVQKIYEHYAQHGTVCPPGRDAVGWAKTLLRNFVIDVHRRRATEEKRSGALAPSARDLAEDVTDQVLARDALVFMESLDPRARSIAMMRWADGLEPREIAIRLGMNPRTVRTSLHRTKRKMLKALGIPEAKLQSEPMRVLGENG